MITNYFRYIICEEVLQSYTLFFFNALLRNQTALLRWFWNLRDRGVTPQIKWRLIKKSSTLGSRCRSLPGGKDKHHKT